MPKPSRPTNSTPASSRATVAPTDGGELLTAWSEAEQALTQFVTAVGDMLTVLRELSEQQHAEHTRLRQHVTALEADGRFVRAFANALNEVQTGAAS